jgi:adenylate cyclase
MGETRKLAAILVADVVGYSRLAGIDEERTLARLRAPRSDLIDPTSHVDMGASSSAPATGSWPSSAASSTQCAARSKSRSTWSNATRVSRRTSASRFRVGIHLGDVVEESDGDLIGEAWSLTAGERLHPSRRAGDHGGTSFGMKDASTLR